MLLINSSCESYRTQPQIPYANLLHYLSPTFSGACSPEGRSYSSGLCSHLRIMFLPLTPLHAVVLLQVRKGQLVVFTGETFQVNPSLGNNHTIPDEALVKNGLIWS